MMERGYGMQRGGSKFIMNIVFDKLHHAPRTVLALYKYGPMKSHRII